MSAPADSLIEQLEKLRAESDELWEAAIEGCVHPDGRPRLQTRARAEQARETANGAWEYAIDAARAGVIDRAHYGLQVAAHKARNWGDDRAAQAALKLLS